MGKFWLFLLSFGYLLVAIKIASSIYVNQLNATKLKSSKAQFQVQFELSLAQLGPSLFIFGWIMYPWIFLEYSWIIPGFSLDYSKIIFGLTLGYPCTITETYLDFPETSHGFSLNYPLIITGLFLNYPWIIIILSLDMTPKKISFKVHSAGKCMALDILFKFLDRAQACAPIRDR